MGFLAPMLFALEGTVDAGVTSFLTIIGELVSTVFGWVATVGTTITASPLLMVFIGIGFVGIGIGIFKRLVRVGK